jgi:hypothetical protein
MKARWRLALGVIALVLITLVLIVGVVAITRDGDRLTEARRLLEDDSRHTTAVASAETMGRVVSLLRAEAGCTDKRSTKCVARYSLAAYAQVVGVQTGRCTAAGRRDLRAGIASYIRAVQTMTDKDRVPGPPPVPHCGFP